MNLSTISALKLCTIKDFTILFYYLYIYIYIYSSNNAMVLTMVFAESYDYRGIIWMGFPVTKYLANNMIKGYYSVNIR